MPGLWKAWKAKGRLPTLPTSPLCISPNDGEIPTFPRIRRRRRMEKWKTKSRFPTFPPPRFLPLKKNKRPSVVPFCSAAVGNFHAALDITWTFGLRITHNSDPMNPHDLVARLPGSFAALSHDVDQPPSEVIRTGLDNLFQTTPLAILQPRTAIAWQLHPRTVLRTGFGLFSDLLPGSIADLIGANPPYVNTFQGGLLGTVGGLAIAPGVPGSAVDATAAANENFLSGFEHGALSCASPLASPNSCLPPVSITAVPDGKLHAPYFMQWSFALEVIV